MRPPWLFDVTPRFDGPAYDSALEQACLTKQLGRIFTLVHDGVCRTLDEIATLTGDPAASVSAQRHLRKPRLGGYRVEKHRPQPDCGSWEDRATDGYGGGRQA